MVSILVYETFDVNCCQQSTQGHAGTGLKKLFFVMNLVHFEARCSSFGHSNKIIDDYEQKIDTHSLGILKTDDERQSLIHVL